MAVPLRTEGCGYRYFRRVGYPEGKVTRVVIVDIQERFEPLLFFYPKIKTAPAKEPQQ